MNTFHLTHLCCSLAAAGLFLVPAAGQSITRVSVSSSGVEGDADCAFESSISADGRFVAFSSPATTMVPGDTNGREDVFVHDLALGLTTRVSVSSLGMEGNQASQDPALSADGRYVVFASLADNLVPGDTNLVSDVFIHDRKSGQTGRVTVNSNGAQANSFSRGPSISADGRIIAFVSRADNLATGDANGEDVFIHEHETGKTTHVASLGVQTTNWGDNPTLSSDGRVIAFRSIAALVPNDSNALDDVYVQDLQSGLTTRVSVSSGGAQATNWSAYPSLTADGLLVGFYSYAGNLVPGDGNVRLDSFVHDRQTHKTSLVSVDSNGVQGNSHSRIAPVSAAGRFVAFFSEANNLVAGDTNGWDDVFVHDRQTAQTTRVSMNMQGVQGDRWSTHPSISADGRFISFMSLATNLAPGDTNGFRDIYVLDRGPGAGATDGTIVLAGDLLVETGQPLTFTFFAAPPGSFARLLFSRSNAGTTLGGHSFGVGPNLHVMARGYCTPGGTGRFVSAPVPAGLLGTTIYFEVGAIDAVGIVYDSNTVARTVQ